jgi:hypothetical protein
VAGVGYRSKSERILRRTTGTGCPLLGLLLSPKFTLSEGIRALVNAGTTEYAANREFSASGLAYRTQPVVVELVDGKVIEAPITHVALRRPVPGLTGKTFERVADSGLRLAQVMRDPGLAISPLPQAHDQLVALRHRQARLFIPGGAFDVLTSHTSRLRRNGRVRTLTA